MKGAGKVRIIGGQWRGRMLKVFDKPGLRPSPNRMRETLFNWLMHTVPNSRCLDLFAGSGAVGIEAASRGAREVILVEQDRDVAQHLKQTVLQLATDKVNVIHHDARYFLRTAPTPFDIAFLDPPFQGNLLPTCTALLDELGWLAPEASIYLEIPSTMTDLTFLPSTWQIIRHQIAGQVAGWLLINHTL
jgi:16S rRNA (guanine966-N2)-methyltransferase